MQNYTTDMSLQEQIGQLFAVGFHGTTPSQEIIDLIRNHHIGSIILFSRNIENIAQVRSLTRQLQSIAKEAGHRFPLLIAVDQENGMVQRLKQGATTFPSNMAQGAIGSEQMVYTIAQATGRELKELGINMNLAPVVDVNNNPANPVIGVRSFGEDPQQVARFGAAAVKGYHKAGVIVSLKHFPGHGDTATDSHMALPTVPYTMERLKALELLPFQRGIEAGADSVMTAHIIFSALAQNNSLPATLSPRILRDLLRKQMGFNGVIISDCLEMNAIANTVGVGRGSLMALQAGADLVLISHQYQRQLSGITTVHEGVQKNEISVEQIRQAAERVLQLKSTFLSWEGPSEEASQSIPWVGCELHRHLQEQAYAASTTLVRNNDRLLPLRLENDQRLLILYPQQGNLSEASDKGYSFEPLVEQISQRHSYISALAFATKSSEQERQIIKQAINQADTIIMVTVNANLDEWQASLMHLALQSGKPTIGIAAYNPYDLLAFPQLNTYLATYEYTTLALTTATRLIFGEIQPQGHLPVTIPGLHTRGSGITGF